MFFPNGNITLRKLQEITNDHDNWKVVAENIYTKEQFSIKDGNDLREYIFYNDYRFGYDFIGDWEEYRKSKDEILFDWKKEDFELKVDVKDEKISAELLMWENNKMDSEDLPTCFTVAYWNEENDLCFVGNRFFEYVSGKDIESEIFEQFKKVQNLLDNFVKE